jgi:hypothetical protein
MKDSSFNNGENDIKIIIGYEPEDFYAVGWHPDGYPDNDIVQ